MTGQPEASGHRDPVPLENNMTLTHFLRDRLTEDGDFEALHQLRHDLVEPRVLAPRYHAHPDFRREWL